MRIKKTSQYIEGGASLSNVYGTSNENGYAQEYINNLETYSTTEKRIGTWIDGKPLYRRTIYSTTTSGSLGLSNVDFLRWKNFNASIDNKFLFSSDRYRNTNDGVDLVIRKDNLTFSYGLGSAWENLFNYLVFDIEYTKTTD